MKANANIKRKINIAKAKKRTKKAMFEGISHVAGTARKKAIKRIRKGNVSKSESKRGLRVHSKPGASPKRWENKSGRSLAYGSGKSHNILYDACSQNNSALVYASPFQSGDNVMQMLERGGSQYVTRIVSERKGRLNPDIFGRERYRQKKMGNYHYKPWHGYRPMEDRSFDEQKYIKAYYDNIRKTRRIKVKARYKQRSFLEPAVKETISMIPNAIQDKIDRYFD